MLSFFRREPPPQEIVPVKFDFPGLYHGVHEVKRQPDAGGARNYAWESLALAEFTPIGPATMQREHWRVTAISGDWYPNQQLPIAGIPTQSGQLVGQPLYDPNAGGSGFLGPDFSMGMPSGVWRNEVDQFGFMDRKNDANPINRRGV
jgi:hypothetical protein